MTNFIIIAIVAVVVSIGVREALKHFRGQGGCCGGGTYKPRKKKLDNVLGKKTVLVEGMSCEHCQNRVHEAVNDIEGLSADVSWKKGVAVVSYDRPVDDDVIRAAIKKAGYMVREIK